MSELVHQLERQSPSRFEDILRDNGFPEELGKLLDDTVAALTIVGMHPAKLRVAALTIMPTTARQDLYAHRLIECHDVDGLSWSLTQIGEGLAQVLAADVPAEDDADRRQAEETFAAILAEANEQLGLND